MAALVEEAGSSVDFSAQLTELVEAIKRAESSAQKLQGMILKRREDSEFSDLTPARKRPRFSTKPSVLMTPGMLHFALYVKILRENHDTLTAK